MNENPLNVLLLGDPGLDDFQPAVAAMRRLAVRDAVQTASDVCATRELVEHGWFPDLIVVWQSWPDQFSQSEVHELLALCPLARLVCCYGPWCDSDGRSRSLWPPGARVAAGMAAARLEHEWSLLAQGGNGTRPLPLTASRAEIFEFDFRPPGPHARPLAGATVVSPDGALRQMLARALRNEDRNESGHDQAAARDNVVFDADPWDLDRASALRAIRKVQPQSRIIVCAGFPRAGLAGELRHSGADDVWFKLAPLESLIALLRGGTPEEIYR